MLMGLRARIRQINRLVSRCSVHWGRNRGGRTIGPAPRAGRAFARVQKPGCGCAAIPPFVGTFLSCSGHRPCSLEVVRRRSRPTRARPSVSSKPGSRRRPARRISRSTRWACVARPGGVSGQLRPGRCPAGGAGHGRGARADRGQPSPSRRGRRRGGGCRRGPGLHRCPDDLPRPAAVHGRPRRRQDRGGSLQQRLGGLPPPPGRQAGPGRRPGRYAGLGRRGCGVGEWPRTWTAAWRHRSG
jgi:hypothetical protein